MRVAVEQRNELWVQPAAAGAVAPRLGSRSRVQRFLHVQLPTWAFRCAWFLALFVHLASITFYVGFAMLYWQIPTSVVRWAVSTYGLSMPIKYFGMIGGVYAFVATIHLACTARMLGHSILLQAFVFRDVSEAKSNSDRRQEPLSNPNEDLIPAGPPRESSTSDGVSDLVAVMKSSKLYQRLSSLWITAFGPHGVFGVHGRYFDLVFLWRETIEMVLQTQQAYRMSYLITRIWMNEFYVALLVLNCWTTPWIRYRFRYSPARARLWCLVSDVGLDFISTVMIPSVIAIPYYQLYNPTKQDFPLEAWYDDVWLVETINESQIMLVNSWIDLLLKVMFAMSLVMALENAKSLLQRLQGDGESGSSRRMATAGRVVPINSFQVSATASFTFRYLKKARRNARAQHLVHGIFYAWGIAVIITHVVARNMHDPENCLLKIRPWFGSKPGCSVLQLRCNSSAIPSGDPFLWTGGKTQFDALLEPVDEGTVAFLVLRHCPRLEMTPRIRLFSQLIGLKIHNSTIVEWNQESSFASKEHPNIRLLFLVDVNMTELPVGLRLSSLPPTLQDIEFCQTNLTELPDDLHEVWGMREIFYLEKSALTTFPSTLLHMGLSEISLSGNPIRTLPSALFEESRRIETMAFSSMPLLQLPKDAFPSFGGFNMLNIANIELDSLPAWITEAMIRQSWAIVAKETKLCDNYELMVSEGIEDVSDTALTVIPVDFRLLRGKIVCGALEPGDDVMYPWQLETA